MPKSNSHPLLRVRAQFNRLLEQLAVLSSRIEIGLHPFRKEVPDGITIGHGNYQYRVHQNWGKQDRKAYPVKNCHEMVQSSAGNLILLTDHPKNNILIYNKAGKIINSWTLGLKTAHGLSISNEGDQDFLFICDHSSGRVIKTTLEGGIVLELTNAHDLGIYKNTVPYNPTETAIAANGDIYVADGYGSFYVIQYSTSGEYIRHFGGPELLNNPHGIAIDSRSNEPSLIVTSRMEQCFKRFTMNGELIDQIPTPGAFVCRPVIHNDILYAAVCWSGFMFQPNSGFVTIIDENDRVVSNPGGTEPRYVEGQLLKMNQDQKVFRHCHDVCIDEDENIYVCQWNAGGSYPIKLERVRD